MVNDPRIVTVQALDLTLRHLAKWRSRLIDNTIVAQNGRRVQSGPFAGMTYIAEAVEASASPKLLGCYEAGLHPIIDEIKTKRYELIVDVGCADGYYAVGFAVSMPWLHVDAYDIDVAAREQCKTLAELNGVSERISIKAELQGAAFEEYVGRNALIFMDIEGAEDLLLRPDLYPSLRKLPVIVECHDAFKPGLSQEIAQRFELSHHVHRVEPGVRSAQLPSWLRKCSELDQLLATWEWRIGPTPWLYMLPK